MRKASLINGDIVDLDELKRHSGWKGENDEITIISEKGDKFLTKVNVSTLINVWIEKEEQDYEDAKKRQR